MSSRRSIDTAGAAEHEARQRPAIRCSGVGARFAENRAVQPLDLDIAPGRVHALVGENGAGKSTLLGLISGRVGPTAGHVEVHGHRTAGGSAREVQKLGVAVVYQEMTLIPALSAIDNIFLGDSSTRFGILDYRPMRKRFARLCEMFDVAIDPSALVSELPIAAQQMLEIFRGIEAGARTLLLDEPTAALAEFERERLHEVIRQLRRDGITVVIVSHNLDEVLALSDDITVLRNGRLTRTAPREEWTRQTLIQAMIGRAVETERYRKTGPPVAGPPRMRARGVTVPGLIEDVAVDVSPGEIVGLWGLVGSGRTTFLRSLVGLERNSRGDLELDGSAVAWNRSIRAAGRLGMVLVPEDRRQALIMGMSGTTNVCIAASTKPRLFLDRRGEAREASGASAFFGFQSRRIGESVGLLSGGNQQKLLLTKWANRDARVMLIDEPTRGIDIGAKAEVLASLVRLAERGSAIIVTSSDLEEVLAVADRILVFNQGRVADEIAFDDSRFTVEEIVRIGFEQKESTS